MSASRLVSPEEFVSQLFKSDGFSLNMLISSEKRDPACRGNCATAKQLRIRILQMERTIANMQNVLLSHASDQPENAYFDQTCGLLTHSADCQGLVQAAGGSISVRLYLASHEVECKNVYSQFGGLSLPLQMRGATADALNPTDYYQNNLPTFHRLEQTEAAQVGLEGSERPQDTQALHNVRVDAAQNHCAELTAVNRSTSRVLCTPWCYDGGFRLRCMYPYDRWDVPSA